MTGSILPFPATALCQAEPCAKNGATKTILVADSDKVHRAFVADMLLGQGYSVVLESNGTQALSRVQSGGIDLVVTAVAMSGMDGLELLRALRDAASSVPVIVIASGMAEIDGVYLRGASLLGAARAFTQPLTPSVFLGSVQELLGQQTS